MRGDDCWVFLFEVRRRMSWNGVVVMIACMVNALPVTSVAHTDAVGVIC